MASGMTFAEVGLTFNENQRTFNGDIPGQEFSENVISADTLNKGTFRAFIEGLIGGDSFIPSLVYIRILTENILSAEVFSIKITARTLIEGLVATGNAIKSPIRTLTEGISASANIVRNIVRLVLEDVQMVSISVYKGLSRSLTEGIVSTLTFIRGRVLIEGVQMATSIAKGAKKIFVTTIVAMLDKFYFWSDRNENPASWDDRDEAESDWSKRTEDDDGGWTDRSEGSSSWIKRTEEDEDWKKRNKS